MCLMYIIFIYIERFMLEIIYMFIFTELNSAVSRGILTATGGEIEGNA